MQLNRRNEEGHKNIKWWKKSVQIETKNKHPTLLFIAYIEVTFLNLQQIQNTAHGYLCY